MQVLPFRGFSKLRELKNDPAYSFSVFLSFKMCIEKTTLQTNFKIDKERQF